MAKYAKPRPGDLIEIFRIGYEHWTIYVGNGYVVHVVAQGSISGDSAASASLLLTEKATVKKELLCDVTSGDKYRVNNKHDDKYRPLPPNKIIQRAEELVGQEMSYNLTSKNCEHFVNDLRYGVPRSDQVIDKTMEKLYLAAKVVLVGLSLVFLPRIPVLGLFAAAGFVEFLQNKSRPEKQ